MAQLTHPPVPRRRSALRLQRRQRHIQGISLTELLIGVVISIVVLGAGVRVLVSLIRGDTATQVEVNRKDAVSRVLGLMQDEILNARRVESGTTAAPLANIDSTNCQTPGQTLLILRGATAAEDISYGLLTEATSATWRGPARLVRCGLPYSNATGQLDTTATRTQQVVVDSLTANGFTPATLGGTGTISRNVQLTLISDASGTPLTSTVQVPIGTNQFFGLAGSGITGTCPNGTGSVTTGCTDPTGERIHYRPTLGGSAITGDADLEDVFYFDRPRADYLLRETSSAGNCTQARCTVRLAPSGASITFTNGDFLVFKDTQIALPP